MKLLLNWQRNVTKLNYTKCTLYTQYRNEDGKGNRENRGNRAKTLIALRRAGLWHLATTRRYVSSSFNLALPHWLAACLHTGQAHYKQNVMCRDRMWIAIEMETRFHNRNELFSFNLSLSSISFRFVWFQFRSIHQCFPFSISCSEFLRFIFNTVASTAWPLAAVDAKTNIPYIASRTSE